MHTPNPPLGLAYVAAAIREARFPYQVVDGTGEALDVMRPYPDRDDLMIEGLSFDEITARIHPDTTVVYAQKAPSCADAISTRRLYWTMMRMFWAFYLLPFLFRPLRVIRTLVKAVATGTEGTRYPKWFVGRVYTRRRWRKLAESAHR